MANFPVDTSKALGADVYGAVTAAKTAIRGVSDHRDAVIQALNGADQNTAASYSKMTSRYGMASDADMMAFFKEMDACVGAASAAILQLAARIK